MAILNSNGMESRLRDEVVDWFGALPSDAPFGHGLFVGITNERDLHSLWHEELQYFLRRGGIATYHDPELIQRGYRWRRDEYSPAAPGASMREGSELNERADNGSGPGQTLPRLDEPTTE